ncbi:hypothetical protein PO909_033973, partial [Leuciscus waleckii]
VVSGSSEATLPSHTRLPPPKPSIVDKKWDQDNGAESSGETDEGQTLLKETKKLQEQHLKSPQSAVTEPNQEDTGDEDEGELDKHEKNSENAVEAEENTQSKPDETEKERHKQREEEEEKERSQKQESGDEEKFPEHQNEREEQKTEDHSEDNQTPGEKDRRDTETVSPQSAVTERMDRENEAEQQHKNEKKIQSDKGQQSVEQQNESMRDQKTKDTANSEDCMRPGEKEERSEEKNQDGIDRANTAEARDHPAVDQLLDDEALSSLAVTDSPANLEKKPINSSDSSSYQTDRSNYTEQDKEEERKRPGLEQEGGQEHMTEEINPDPETQSCKQTDSDTIINSVSQRLGHDHELSRRDEEVQTTNLKQSPQSAVSETNQEDTGDGDEGELDKNEKNSEHAVEAEENTHSKPDETEKERHKQRQEEEEKERSQKQESGDEEKFPEHQNEREEQKTEDHSEDNQTPGEKEETEDRRDTDSPANLEKKPINSSDSSSNKTDQDQEEEVVRNHPGSELDEEETGATNQEPEGGQEQTPEEKNPDPEIHEEQSCINADKQDKQTDSNSVSQRQLDDGLSRQDEEVPNKSKMTDNGQSFKLIDNNTKVVQNEGETEVQTQPEDSGNSGQRDMKEEMIYRK